jgi:hypothetical protein
MAASAQAMDRVRVNPLRSDNDFSSAQGARPVANKTGDYRADIDGLRAIAMLLVLLFQGGSSIFSSGFIGVEDSSGAKAVARLRFSSAM